MLKKIFVFVLLVLFIFIAVYGIFTSVMVRIFMLWLGVVLLIGGIVTNISNKIKHKRPSDRH